MASISDAEIDGRLNTLKQQRDSALDQIVMLGGHIATLQALLRSQSKPASEHRPAPAPRDPEEQPSHIDSIIAPQ